MMEWVGPPHQRTDRDGASTWTVISVVLIAFLFSGAIYLALF
jgi:hypothetical protein